MSAPPKNDRNVIPRWRGYEETLRVGELEAPRLIRPRTWMSRRSGLAARAEEYERNRKASFAADFIGSAVVLGGDDNAVDAARELLEKSNPGRLLGDAARRIIEESEGERERAPLDPREHETGEEIGRLRRSTRRNARNPVRWSELARHFTIRGEDKKARRAMQVARGLAPEDRYVLRSAARLEIHQGRPSRAASLLREIAGRSGDPWLVAAGLGAAGAAEEGSGLVRIGRRILDSGRFSDFETSELASALATLEIKGGNDRAARRLFRQALREPTDNSIAQAEWASAQAGGIEIPDAMLGIAESWEARALRAANGGDRSEVLREAWSWHYDQPFASRPGELGSYHASVESEFEAGARIARAALRANPKEFLLLNNYAFCLASMDCTDEAATAFSQIKVGDLEIEDRATYLATRGLISFRQGRIEEGRAFYKESIATWRNRNNRALAMIMLAREELRAATREAIGVEEEARQAGEESGSAEILAWLKQLDRWRSR